MAMYHIRHEVEPSFGGLKMTLASIRPDLEIRYTTNGDEPAEYSQLYRRPLEIKSSQVVKCATFKDGKRMGETLVVPVQLHDITGKNVLRSNRVERRVVNGVRGSLKNTDGEWASWAKNDSICLTFDVGNRKNLTRLWLGCLNDFGLAIHKPAKIEVWLSNNDVSYWKAAEKQYDAEKVFCEGRYVEDLALDFDDSARYVRLILKGVGKCPKRHVRPGMEARIYIDEVSIE